MITTATDVDFYDTDITYDENSNVTVLDQHIHTGFDVEFTIDDLDRLINAEEGTWSGSAIGTMTREEIWELTQTGNWGLYRRNLNGDADYIDTKETDEERTHNKANELTDRDLDTDDNGTYGDTAYDLDHDANGNLIDDKENYKYVYDAFNRLRKVLNTSTQAPVAEYRYNGLNHRITMHQDTDTDGDVDGNDTIVHFVYDERWRVVTTYHDSDTGSSAKEEYIYHHAGFDGFGGSSYIDDVALRDFDGVFGAGLDSRHYLCQNWRHDVVALVTDDGKMQEWVAYSSYGVPFGLPKGDADSSGSLSVTDVGQIQIWINTATYDVRGDVDLDGDVDAADKSAVSGQSISLGRGKLSNIGNDLGYAGYVFDPKVGNKWHVRYRVLESELGRWLTRDPAGYNHGASSLFAYAYSSPVVWIDPRGLHGQLIPPRMVDRAYDEWPPYRLPGRLDPLRIDPPSWISPRRDLDYPLGRDDDVCRWRCSEHFLQGTSEWNACIVGCGFGETPGSSGNYCTYWAGLLRNPEPLNMALAWPVASGRLASATRILQRVYQIVVWKLPNSDGLEATAGWVQWSDSS